MTPNGGLRPPPFLLSHKRKKKSFLLLGFIPLFLSSHSLLALANFYTNIRGDVGHKLAVAEDIFHRKGETLNKRGEEEEGQNGRRGGIQREKSSKN